MFRGGIMKFPRRKFLYLAAGAAALPALPRLAKAQAYPSRPIRLIIGYTPGGSADLTARLMGQWLSERLGQSFVVENRPDGGTNIATEAVVRAPPDGYTFLLAAPANAINATLYDKLNFNFLRDSEPVAGIIRFPNVVVVNPSVPVKPIPASSIWHPPAMDRQFTCPVNYSKCSQAPIWSTCPIGVERRRSRI